MELIMKPVTFPDAIEFNFEELKKEITEKVSEYTNLVYSDDQIKEAKADRAKMNSFTKALADERIRVKKQCMAPYEEFESKVKTLEDIVRKATMNIDAQVKGYEEKKKAEKLDSLKALWSEMNPPERLPFDIVFQPKFLNASMSLRAVKQWFVDAIDKYNRDIETLKALDAFSFESIEEYHRSFSLTVAIQEGQRLADIQRRKEEQEKARKEREEQQAKAQHEAEFSKCMNPPEPVQEPEPVKQPEKEWISFKVLLSEEDAHALVNFFTSRNIEYEPI